MNEFNMEDKNDELGLPINKSVKPNEEIERIPIIQKIKKKDNLNAATSEALKDKIIKITLIIKAKFHELSKFLDEMPESMPDQNHPEITLQDLSEYYQSLNAVLTKYQLEHPKR